MLSSPAEFIHDLNTAIGISSVPAAIHSLPAPQPHRSSMHKHIIIVVVMRFMVYLLGVWVLLYSV